MKETHESTTQKKEIKTKQNFQAIETDDDKIKRKKKNYDEERNEIEVGLVPCLLGMQADRSLHHGVLPHQDDGIAAEALPDVLELIRSDVIGGGDQDLAVLIEKLAKLLVVGDLLLGLRCLHSHLLPNYKTLDDCRELVEEEEEKKTPR